MEWLWTMTNELNALLSTAPPTGDALVYLYLPAVGVGVGLALVLWFVGFGCSKIWQGFKDTAE